MAKKLESEKDVFERPGDLSPEDMLGLLGLRNVRDLALPDGVYSLDELTFASEIGEEEMGE